MGSSESRSSVLQELSLDDPPPNFERMTDMAVRIAGADTGMITALNEEHQLFMAQCRADYDPMDRQQSVCQFALNNKEGAALAIPDMTDDERTMGLDLVVDDGYRSYLGLPVIVDGHVIGTLCILDSDPRHFDEPTRESLRTLAREVAERLKQRRTQKRLSEQKRRFEQIAQSINEVFYMTDPGKNEMLYCSPAVEGVWGLTPDELLDDHDRWVESIHPEDRDRVLEAAQNDQMTGEYDETYRIYDTDGGLHYIHDKAFPIYEDNEVTRIVGVAEDITDYKKQQQALRQKERMASIGEMSSMIMHEVNNPNSVIQGNLDFLSKATDRLQTACASEAIDDIQQYAEQLDETVQSMRNGTQRIEAIVEDVKRFAHEAHKRKNDERSTIAIKDLCEEVATIGERFDNPDGLVVDCPCDPRERMVPLSREEFASIVTNLVENALEATDPDDRDVVVTMDTDEALVLTVDDNGGGIPASMKGSLFEPFETSKDSGSGTGLGLAIIHSIIQRANGSVTVESEQDRGSTFTVRLPLLTSDGVTDSSEPPAA